MRGDWVSFAIDAGLALVFATVLVIAVLMTTLL